MPRQILSLPILRKAVTYNAMNEPTGDYAPIPSSPGQGWPCRLYRRNSATIERHEEHVGIYSKDTAPVCSVLDTSCGVQINDAILLPGGKRALVIRVRAYDRSIQCDLEEGTEN